MFTIYLTEKCVKMFEQPDSNGVPERKSFNFGRDFICVVVVFEEAISWETRGKISPRFEL